MTFRYCIRVLSSAAVLLCVSACSQGGAADRARNETVSSGPAQSSAVLYYLDQVWTGRGISQGRSLSVYEDQLKNCKNIGGPIVPLDPTDVAKLGMTRVQTWQDERRWAKRTDSWEPVTAGGSIQNTLCHFTGVKQITKVKISILPDKVYALDLSKDTGTMERIPQNFGKPALSPADIADIVRKAESDGLRKLGEGHVAGQPCTRWRYGTSGSEGSYEQCVWSGGVKWGFPPVSGLVLSQMDIGDPQNGAQLETRQMIVGHLPEAGKVFDIPNNISIRVIAPAPEVSGQ